LDDQPEHARSTPHLDPASQIAIHRRAALLKANDKHSRKMIRTDRLVMPYYNYRAREIIPAAFCQSLTVDDYLVTIYRGIHGRD